MGSIRGFLLFAALLITPGAQAQLCPEWLQEWGVATARWIRPELRAWNRSLYEIARAQSQRGNLALSQLDTPEKLFAYVDNLTPRRPFQSQIAAIEALGGKVVFKNYRFALKLEHGPGWMQWQWAPRAPDSQLKSQWRSYYGLPYRSREALSILTHANAPPRTGQELVDWVLQYGSALAHHRLRLKAGYSGWTTGPWAFPAQALDELEGAESDQYSALEALQRTLPEVTLDLPETDGVWARRRLQTALGLPIRILFPTYLALSPYRANRESMRAWQQGALRELLRTKYEARLRWKWLIDRYRRALLATTLVALPPAIYHTAEDLFSGELWQRLGQMEKDLQELPERYTAPRVNEDIRNYYLAPGGDPIINEHYNAQIREIEATIARSGDPDGKLRQRIEKLIQTRDLLNH